MTLTERTMFDLFISAITIKYEAMVKGGYDEEMIQDFIYSIDTDLEIDYEMDIDEQGNLRLDRAGMLDLLKTTIDRAKQVEEVEMEVIEQYLM